MFAYFESRIRPTLLPKGSPPPGLIAFYWHFVRQTRWLYAAMFTPYSRDYRGLLAFASLSLARRSQIASF